MAREKIFQKNTSENHIFINPRFSTEKREELLSWIACVQNCFRSHIFLLSSGTTAHSTQDLKWVALSRESLLQAAEAANQHLMSSKKDIWLNPLPDFHVGGLSIWARSYLSGARVIKLSEELKWNVDRFMTALISNDITLTSLVPAQIFDLILHQKRSPSSLRAVLVGGGALTEALYIQARKLGWPLLPTYGMTETCSQIATAELASLKNHEDSSGTLKPPPLKILPHLQIAINHEGRIKVKGPALLSSYILYQNGKIQCFDPKVLDSGWFLTQDRGNMQDQYLKILGRIGEFIKIGGESVELSRLRNIFDEILCTQGIQFDAALIPFPDERLEHVIYLIGNSELTPVFAEKLIKEFNSKVLGFERIRKWYSFPDQLPRNSLGKLILSECYHRIQFQVSPQVLYDANRNQ